MKQLLREAVTYAAASAGALAVDMAILWILVDFFSWGYVQAASVSFLAGAMVAYGLSIRFVFAQHRLRNRSVEMASFIAIGTAGVAVNAGVMSIAVRYFGIHYLIAKCVAAGCTCICNFVARRQMLFVRSSTV